jgi:hypothetical protein
MEPMPFRGWNATCISLLRGAEHIRLLRGLFTVVCFGADLPLGFSLVSVADNAAPVSRSARIFAFAVFKKLWSQCG